MDRRELLKGWAAAAALGGMVRGADRISTGKPNLLFLMTDQQQGAALSCDGNKVLRTPNLDRLAASGARFSRAYSACPICVPARTSLLTGQSLSATGIRQNGQLKKAFSGTEGIFNHETFFEVLAKGGWTTEYWGKWHSVDARTACFQNRAVMDDGKDAYEAFVRSKGKKIPPAGPGEIIDRHTRCPYVPDPLDSRYGQAVVAPGGGAPKDRRTLRQEAKGRGAEEEDEEGEAIFGRLCLDASVSRTAFVGEHVVDAIERLHGRPFALAGSFGPPHPPMITPRPYHGMYPAAEMPLPPSFRDPMAGSPYADRWAEMRRFQDPKTIGYLTSNYYGLIREVDDWIGKILGALERHGLLGNTLIVFTSDHGEMLGAHGLSSKMTFYDEAARIPMILSRPGLIPKQSVIEEPVGHIDLFPTLLECMGVDAPPCQGESLKPLMTGAPDHRARKGFCVSEWVHRNAPAFMVRTKTHKLIMADSPTSKAVDALYDLAEDPHEMRNLLGSGASATSLAVAGAMKEQLLSWLQAVKSPAVEGVRGRIFGKP